MKFTAVYLIILFATCTLSAQTFTDFGPTQNIQTPPITIDGQGSGISSYDYNKDGWDDLSILFENDTQRIYLNNQGVLEPSNLSFYAVGEVKHLLWVDYDNDYDNDIFLTRQGGNNMLLQNDGNFQFTDVTLSVGLPTTAAQNYGASFADYDLDGDLDLYICKYQSQGDSTNLVNQNNLFRNNGDGTFTDVTFGAGLAGTLAPSFQGLWYDWNGDRFPELFVINDRSAWLNEFYLNNQDGTFTRIADSVGLEMPNSEPMSISLADFDNDEDFDLFVSDAGQAGIPRGSLHTALNDLTFTDEANNVGIGIEGNMWGSTWLDYNNDGFQDLFVATSAPLGRNSFYINGPSGVFTQDTSVFLGDYNSISFSTASADFNRDGFADFAVVNSLTPNAFLWMNNGVSNNHYIRISLEGTVSNSNAIGTLIKVYESNQVYSRYTVCGENYLGQNSQNYLFGLGAATTVDSVKLFFPSGVVNTYTNLSVDTSYLFIENATQTFNISVLNDTSLCEGDTLSLSAPVFEEYLWSNGDTTASLDVSETGLYSLSAIDDQGGQYQSNEVYVYFLPRPTVAATSTNVTCYGELDGEIQLIVNGAYGDYTISWDNGNQGDSLLNLSAGDYIFVYSDSLACSLTDTIKVEEPPQLNVQYQIQNETTTSLGALDVLINGGAPPYSIYLNDSVVSTPVDSLSAGIYELEILDFLNCPYSALIEVAFEDSTLNSIAIINESSIVASPNPVESIMVLQNISKGLQHFEAEVYNLHGKQIAHDTFDLRAFSKAYIDAEEWLPGVYFLVIQIEDKHFQQLILKK